jgi:hypothetical protein
MFKVATQAMLQLLQTITTNLPANAKGISTAEVNIVH